MPTSRSKNQTQYWNLFYDLSVYFYYLQIYQERDQVKMRSMNIFLAISSSSSIAAWAVWRQASWLWAIIIAASQVLNVVTSYLPYKQRERTLRLVLPQMHELLLDCEDKYDAVSKGELTDRQIHQEAMMFKRQLSSLSNELYSCGLPERKGLFKIAEKRAKQKLAEYNN